MSIGTSRPGTAASTRALTGLERLQSGLASDGAEVPFVRVLPITRRTVEHGRAESELPPVELTRGFAELGMVGHLVALADASLGDAVLSTLGAGVYSVAQGLRMDLYSGAVGGGSASFRSHHLGAGGATALAEGTLEQSGRPIARAVLRASVLAAGGSPGRRPQVVPTPAPPVDDQTADTGLDLPWLTAYPLSTYDADGRRVQFTCAAGPTLRNSLGSLHGGAGAILLDLAGVLAARAALDGEPTLPLDVSLTYLRPTTTARVAVTAEVTRLGRSVIAVSHELRDADGRLTVIASSTRLRCAIDEQPSLGRKDI